MAVETRYALSREAHIAYQVLSDGELDLLFVPSFMSNIELSLGHSAIGSFMERLARFTRLIQFDRRGNGMSDGAGSASTLEEQLDDVSAVLDGVGSRETAMIAVNEGAALALLYAATYPERVRALVLMTPQARLVSGPGYEWALSAEQRSAAVQVVVEQWGRDSTENPWLVFGGQRPDQRAAMARYQRLAMGPGDAAAALALAGETDVRDVLGSIQCPTLVLRRQGDPFIDERHCRYVAEQVPGAHYVQLSGDGQIWIGDREEAAREIEDFLTGVRPPLPSERVLATVLFTDIVGSTELAGELGDTGWRELLEQHDALLNAEVRAHRGRVVKSLGDGALALFDGPTRALGCAVALGKLMHGLGVSIRAGLHTGECELLADEDVGGIAVHIAARISALAGPDEVLASSTVRDLSVGSPFRLESRGEQRFKGVADPWLVFAVAAESPSRQT
ncbi:MAG TPA: adenylate/guanylate cyclase domain-containing protein [Solirubrobacteraceae bacterium]|nr:adenylate/guanylate cyclase domain-containing protein [Solirubrobacteraceae bacterium]